MTVAEARRNHVDLVRAYRDDGDPDARAALVLELLPLVRSLAARYAGRGEQFDDIVQAGSIGLLNAIDRFDPDRGVELTTFAVPTILGEIKRHFRDRTWAVHVPRRLKELGARLTRLVEDLSAELGRSPTIAELAQAAGAEEEEVIEALDASRAYSPSSLSAPAGEQGESELLDALGTSDAGFDRVEDASVVSRGLEALAPRERRILKLRFSHGRTQSEIAAELGISQMHVSRLLRKALETMHGRILEDDVTT